ncbi:MAG: hypothetical protein ACNA7G_07110 [Methylobacter sp.]
MPNALAAPPLDLKLTGSLKAPVGKPSIEVNVHLINPAAARQDARLRLFIHDGAERNIQHGDINIEVQEKGSWVAIPLELIDGGIMGAIGNEGTGHKDRHRRGGFTIPNHWNKLWRLRITLGLPGTYSLVAAVSPDNGNVHLAQPAHVTLEAL